jgi:hypothetical protein
MNRFITGALAVGIVLSLTGCSSPPEDTLSNIGTEITESDDGNASVYEIRHDTVDRVAKEILQDAKSNGGPQYKVSKKTHTQILLWDEDDEELVNLRQKGRDVIAEVDQKDFAKKHYSTAFLAYYFGRSSIRSMFDGEPTGNGTYKGYTGTRSAGATFETPEEFHASVSTESEASEAHVSVDAAR